MTAVEAALYGPSIVFCRVLFDLTQDNSVESCIHTETSVSIRSLSFLCSVLVFILLGYNRLKPESSSPIAP